MSSLTSNQLFCLLLCLIATVGLVLLALLTVRVEAEIAAKQASVPEPDGPDVDAVYRDNLKTLWGGQP